MSFVSPGRGWAVGSMANNVTLGFICCISFHWTPLTVGAQGVHQSKSGRESFLEAREWGLVCNTDLLWVDQEGERFRSDLQCPFLPVLCPEISFHHHQSTNTSPRTVPSSRSPPSCQGVGYRRDGPWWYYLRVLTWWRSGQQAGHTRKSHNGGDIRERPRIAESSPQRKIGNGTQAPRRRTQKAQEEMLTH